MTDRNALFYLVCVPSRLLVARYATFVPYMRYIAAAVGTTWLLGLPDKSVGFFGGNAWWAKYRPLHGVLWLAYAATRDNRYLYADPLLGVAVRELLVP